MRIRWTFWLVAGPVIVMLCLCVAARCCGDGVILPGSHGVVICDFTAPSGMYRIENGVAVLNTGYCPGGGCPYGSCPSGQCPGGVCPVPQQPPWRPAQPTQRPRHVPPQHQTNAAVCRIHNQAGSGACLGSGTLVDVDDGRGLVLTCAHLFTEGTGKVVCQFPSGKRLAGTAAVDRNRNDLAAIIIADPGVAPVQVAKQMPGRGELAVSAGYGGQGRYATNAGYITRVFGNQFELTGAARGGDSGGPVFDRHGRLIGVLWGTDGRTVVATTCTTADGFLVRAGRYLLPYRNGVEGRLDGLQQQVNGLQAGQYLTPPGSTGDTAGLSARVSALEQRQAALEARQDKVRQTAEALAAKYESKLPGITKDVERAIAESQAAATGLKEALDEDNPNGLFGRIKARIEERLGGIFEVVPWLKYGLIGVAIGLGYLFLRKEGAKAAAGEQTAWQRVAALTPTEIDDRVAAKVAAGQAALHERLAGLHGTVANLAGSVAAMAKDKIHPTPPTTGA